MVVETYRGCQVVEPDMPAEELADDVIARLARWFTANIGDDGSLPYKYWPSSGEYSEADNPSAASWQHRAEPARGGT